MMDINVDLLQWSISFLIKKLELVKELHKATIRKLKKRKVHSPFIDNIWGADLTDMQLINKFNKGFRFLLRVIDTYSKYETNNKDPKFKIGDVIRISKHKNTFTKGYIANWSEEVFVIKKRLELKK